MVTPAGRATETPEGADDHDRSDSLMLARSEGHQDSHVDCDVVIVGAGLSGLVVARELAAAGRSVILIDGEPPQSIGGQAHWSFGGLFMVNTPEQRRLRIRDSEELAMADWLGSAGFDRAEDHWPKRWAEAYVHFASEEKRRWLHGLDVRWFPLVQWAERGGS